MAKFESLKPPDMFFLGYAEDLPVGVLDPKALPEFSKRFPLIAAVVGDFETGVKDDRLPEGE